MHGDVQPAIRCSRHSKVGIAEGAVGKPVSKGKQWLNLLLVEPAIAYIETLRESRFALHALSRALRMEGVGRWIVFKTPTPRERKSPARVYSAEKDVGRGPSAFIPGPPHL